MTSPKKYAVAAGIVAVLFTSANLWIAYRCYSRTDSEIAALKIKLLRAENITSKATAKAEELSRQLQAANQVLASQAKAVEGDQNLENTLDAWIQRIDRLKNYLSAHKDRWIPEMAQLSASDWLDATKDARLDSEADYRKALAKLRGRAREKSAPIISDALTKALSASHGVLPEDPQKLAAYLPEGFYPDIMQRFQINPSGKVKWIRGDSAIVLIESPVDDLWDSKTFYGTDGTWGVRLVQSGSERLITNAITEFQRATGAMPTSPAQLNQYLAGSGVDQAVLDAMFRALTTKP